MRRARAKDLSELISQTLNTSLIRWIVDLNFGTDVDSPKIYRDFEPKEDVQLSMADVAILVKDVGLKPTVQWVTNRFDVELEEEEGQNMVPDGPEGTSGVDTSPRGDGSIPAEPGQVEAQAKYDGGDVDSIIDSILGDNPDEDETVAERPMAKVDKPAPNPTGSAAASNVDGIIDDVLAG